MIAYLEFCKKIKIEREKRFLTQKEIAYKIPISIYKYSRIENGICEPSFFVLQRLCDIFELDFNTICQIKKPTKHLKTFD